MAMGTEPQAATSACLEDILITEALSRRPPRPPDYQAESEALHALARHLANRPDALLQALVRTALRLCRAGTAGISLLEPTPGGEEVFRWVALAGAYERYEGGTTPADFSPCGTCLERRAPQLYSYPARRFTYFQGIEPPIVEGLVLPFGEERPVLGTVWIVSHDRERQFDAEDVRVMTGLADFTAAALRTAGLLQSLREGEGRLEAELTAMCRLHELSTRLLRAPDLRTALDEILDAAVTIHGADLGNVQLYDPQAKVLEIVAQRGFRPDFLTFFRRVDAEDDSACGRAIRCGRRVIIEDVLTDPDYEPYRPIAAAADYRAVQSTPVLSRKGALLGVLSTHFRRPHRPSERDLRLLDLYARQAADFIERIRAEKALQDADRRKDEFLATLAHELRNPLAPVRNAVEVLRLKGPPGSELEWARGVIDRQVQQMTRLIDDLLDISRIACNKLELRKEPVKLETVVQGAVETSRPLIEQHGHELAVTLPPDPILLDADLTRLAQVFSNLLNNAAKYTERGGRIGLTAERQGSDAVVAVKDTGTGIPADMLPHVFEMYSQVGRTLERSEGGLGIGLALVKRLVEMHGGSIEARSDGPGKGSEFVVRLPVVLTPPEAHRDKGEGRQAAPASHFRILVVDDNRDAADSLGMMLRLMGNDPRTAYDGLEAVAAAGEFRPDVVLLDIGLPKLNGYEAAQRIRGQPWGQRMVLIALTGWGQEEDRRRSREAGFDHHMVKPVDPAALMNLLAGLQRSLA